MNNRESVDKKEDGRSLNRRARFVGAARVPRAGTHCAWSILVFLLLVSLRAFAADVEKFAALQVGDNVYQNVTVTTKARDFILIAHSSGITSIKVKELPEDVREKLGYVNPSKSKRQAVEHLIGPPVAKGAALMEGAKAKLFQVWDRIGLVSKMQVLRTYRGLILAIAILLVASIFCSYCSMLICQKTGNAPAVLLWLPFLQPVPLLRAASMSTWWFLALFVPGLNLLVYVRWCLRIVEARHKTMPLAILLIFPLTSWLAFIFLAFSEDSRDDGQKLQVQTMTLETCLGASGAQTGPRALSREQRMVA